MRRDFETEHRRQFGFIQPDKPVWIEAISVEATGGGAGLAEKRRKKVKKPPQPIDTAPLYVDGAWRDVAVYDRKNLRPGQKVAGPALIIEANSTTVVEPGWRARLNRLGHLVLKRVEPLARRA